MGIDPITGWFICWVCGKLADKALGHLIGDAELGEKLDKAVVEWAKSLGEKKYVNPQALFSSVAHSSIETECPEYNELQQKLLKNNLPSKDDWYKVFMENWHYVKRTISEPQAFFILSEPEASEELEKLAEATYNVCKQHEPIFKSLVIEKLNGIEGLLRESLPRVGAAESFIAGVSDEKTPHTTGATAAQEPPQRLRLETLMGQFEYELVKNFPGKHRIEGEVVCGDYAPMVDMPKLVERASNRKETVGKVAETVQRHDWTAITGECGSGKTQLAVLLVTKTNKLGGWLGLRDAKDIREASVHLDSGCKIWSGEALGKNRREWYDKLCGRFGAGSWIVIDDIPKLDGSDELSMRLALLAEACKTRGVKLVSTSNFKLPSTLMNQIGSELIAPVDVPSFNDSEVKELFSAYGALEGTLSNGFVSFVNVLAGGNPALLVAVARYLQKKHWALSKDELEGLLKGKYADKVNEETIARLVTTVEDSHKRELLYRLRLITFSFTNEDVKAVASVDPRIKRPLEKLNSLVGLWVQAQGDNTFSVSPLIRGLGTSDLATGTERGTYLVAAERIMSIMHTRHMTQWEVQRAVVYYVLGKAHQRAAAVLFMVFQSMLSFKGEFEDAGLTLFWRDTELPEDIELGMRIALRGMQICVCEKRGYDTGYLVRDLHGLARAASKSDGWAVFLAVSGILAGTKLCEKEMKTICDLLAIAMAFLPRCKLPDGSEIETSRDFGPEVLIWISAHYVRDAEQLLSWLGMLERISQEQRKSAFKWEDADELCIVVANAVFLHEFKKPEESQDWDKVLEVLNDFAERVAKLELWWLWACANYTKMIVLAEHVDKFDGAIEIGHMLLEKLGRDARVAFLINQYVGRQYYFDRDFENARVWLEKALEQDTKIEKAARLSSLLCFGHITGEKETKKCVEFVENAVKVAEILPDFVFNKYKLVEALAELAIAKWLVGGVNSAFEAWERGADELLKCKNDSEDWKALYMGYGHVCGYFAGLASSGKAPDETHDGQAYVTPWRGMFIGAYLKRAEAYPEGRESLFMVQVAIFAEAVGNDERAIVWAERAVEAARRDGRPVAISAVGFKITASAVLKDEYAEAIDFALECGKLTAAELKLHEMGKFELDAEFEVEEILGKKPSELWENAEHMARIQSLVPIAFRLAFLLMEEGSVVGKCTREVVDRCCEVAEESVAPEVWEAASDLFEGIFLNKLSISSLKERAHEFYEKKWSVLHVITYLGLSVHGKTTPKEACAFQLAIMPWIYKMIKPNSVMFRGLVLPFIVQFWCKRFSECPALFSSPPIVDMGLKEACKKPKSKRVQAIFKVIKGGLNIRVNEDIQRWLAE